jgi:CDP-glycerol glycerophosphotransferase
MGVKHGKLKLMRQKIKYIKPSDIGHLFLFLCALPVAFFYRRFRRNLWLVCEYGNEACDNGFCFFEYLRLHQPQQDAVYAIRKASPQYKNVKKLGEVVEFGSFKHWVYYLAAEKNISSQKGGKPNAAVCYFLEVPRILRNKRAFIQHGIVLNDLPYLHKGQAQLGLITCGAKPECEFIKARFGYEPEQIKYTGLCRFDKMFGKKGDPNIILVAPTWRQWLYGSDKRSEDLQKEEYFIVWNRFLNDKRLHDILRRKGLEIVFYPHRNIQFHSELFSTDCDNIKIRGWANADILELIKSAGLLITDYSSISMDFAYMEKPLLYYQFDYPRFRAAHLPQGYFSYKKDGFGRICSEHDELINEMERLIEAGLPFEDEYKARHKLFYALYDDKNCERNYLAVKLM